MCKFLVSTLLVIVAFARPVTAGDAQSIQGVWRFEKAVDTRSDGSIIVTGSNRGVEGFIIYTADGFVSSNIMPKGRRWTVDNATVPEFRETIEAGTAYVGRYEVDPATHTVTHIIAVSVDPADEKKRLIRKYSLHGDTLALSGTWLYQGETLNFTLTWTRATS
jgi:hypothetical protein